MERKTQQELPCRAEALLPGTGIGIVTGAQGLEEGLTQTSREGGVSTEPIPQPLKTACSREEILRGEPCLTGALTSE